jgi:urease accessory protein
MQRWLDLLQVVDSSFPSGSYAHSSGLESLGADRLQAHLELRVREGLGRFELVFVLHAYTWPLSDLDKRLHVMLLPFETRRGSALVGTALLRAACDLVRDARLSEFLAVGPHRHHAVAFGAIATMLDVPPRLAAQTYAFMSLRGHVSAAQRLGWLGQREAQRMLHALKSEVHMAVDTACGLDLDEAGAFAPTWDVASMAHEFAPARLFAS